MCIKEERSRLDVIKKKIVDGIYEREHIKSKKDFGLN